MTESDLILVAVRRWFPPRRWAVCDNVYWGFGLSYEADAICISKSGTVHELEAKSTRSDLERDAKKRKWKLLPETDLIWYVVATELAVRAEELARPLGLGLIVVSEPAVGYVLGDCERVLVPRRRRNQVERVERVRDRRNRIWRLAGIRYWDEKVRSRCSNA